MIETRSSQVDLRRVVTETNLACQAQHLLPPVCVPSDGACIPQYPSRWGTIRSPRRPRVHLRPLGTARPARTGCPHPAECLPVSSTRTPSLCWTRPAVIRCDASVVNCATTQVGQGPPEGVHTEPCPAFTPPPPLLPSYFLPVHILFHALLPGCARCCSVA